MKNIVLQTIFSLVNVCAVYYLFQYAFKLNYDFNQQIDYEMKIVNDKCFLGVVNIMNGTELTTHIINYSHEYILSLLERSNIYNTKING